MRAWPLLTHLSLPPPGRAAEPGSKCGLALPLPTAGQPPGGWGCGPLALSWPAPVSPQLLSHSLSLLPGKTSHWSPRSGGQVPNGPRRFPGAGQGGEASRLGCSLSKWCVWSGVSARPPGAPRPPTGYSWRAGHKDSLAGFPLGSCGRRAQRRSHAGYWAGLTVPTPRRGVLRRGRVSLPARIPDPDPGVTVGAPRPRGQGHPSPHPPPPEGWPSSSPSPSRTLLPSTGAFFAGTPPTKHPGAPEPRGAPGLESDGTGTTRLRCRETTFGDAVGGALALGAGRFGPLLGSSLLNIHSAGHLVKCRGAEWRRHPVPRALLVGWFGPP